MRTPGIPPMQNVEYKCELRDIRLARAILRELGATFIGVLRQTDTYYRTTSGRLKRRETEGEETEWILYERPDRLKARISNFTIYSHEQARERFGNLDMPVRSVVRKVRELWMIRNTRIHLDDVAGLGLFFELESLVGRDHPAPRAHEAVDELRRALAPVLGEPIDTSYGDMCERELPQGMPADDAAD